jgi:Zn-dependent protease with chaperone function
VSRRLAAALLASCFGMHALAQTPPSGTFTDPAQLAALDPEERRLWEYSEEIDLALRRGDHIYRDARATAWLQDLVDRLFPDFRGHTRVRILDDPAMNAFALPNGSLYMNLGMLARAENEAQVATVLAHEGSHFLSRHGVRQRDTTIGLATLAQIVGMVAGVYGIVGQVLALAAITGYSRDNEREADAQGFERYIEAGYDPRETVRTFEILAREIELAKIDEPFFFSSHPKVQDRIDTFRTLAAARPSAGSAPPLPQWWNELRDAWLEAELARGKFASVVHWLSGAGRDRFPAHADYYLGEAYRLRDDPGDEARALEAWRRAVQRSPDFAPSYRALALAHWKRDEAQQARALLARYLELAPQAADRAFVEDYLGAPVAPPEAPR